jgi:two-component system phosphate regulon sensor histidine kinase PhoR
MRNGASVPVLRLTQPGPLDSGYVCVFPIPSTGTITGQLEAILLAIGVLTIVVVTITSLNVATRTSQPIRNMLKAAHAIKNGDLDHRIRVMSSDELGELSKAINDMAEKLGADIIHLKRLERVRSEFLANVSHELRTPIFSIQGFLETLLDGAVDDPSVNRDFLQKAHRHAERLNTLLNDLIEISRIESGEMKMSFRYFAIAELLESIVDELSPEAAKKSIALKSAPEVMAGHKVYGDKERLRQVLSNLIDNAIKYTDPGGSITLAARTEGSCTRISVTDTGMGIPERHLSRIFERFYRVDRARSRDVGGTGLGLAIAKHIVEAHGGTIRVDSEIGRGSVFSFTLKH